MMLGGAVTGGLIMALSAELSAPHGGIFVAFAMGGTGGILKFFISLAAGVIVAAVAVVFAKTFLKSKAEESADSVALANA